MENFIALMFVLVLIGFVAFKFTGEEPKDGGESGGGGYSPSEPTREQEK